MIGFLLDELNNNAADLVNSVKKGPILQSYKDTMLEMGGQGKGSNTDGGRFALRSRDSVSPKSTIF